MLWFAFKLYLYRVLSHPLRLFYWSRSRCDLLSNCIFIEFYHIDIVRIGNGSIVVICFQIVSLSSSITSQHEKTIIREPLWFAFKLYLYRVLSHHGCWLILRYWRCDLLSNCIFIEFYHIEKVSGRFIIPVVICFQIVSLSSSITSDPLLNTSRAVLWFAFKLYLYRVLSHRLIPKETSGTSCDLLSNCIFIEFYHIWIDCEDCYKEVVICFQIVSLSSSITSMNWTVTPPGKLWFAFKLYLYRVLSHRWDQPYNPAEGCDLLSNCIFIEFYHIVC